MGGPCSQIERRRENGIGACLYSIGAARTVKLATSRLSAAAPTSELKIEDLKHRGGLKDVDVANIAKVSKATVTRWSAGSHSPHPKTQLMLSDLRYVVDRLAEFHSPDEVRVWLNSRNELLDGRRAIDLIHDGRTEIVLEAVERLGDLAYL